MRAGCLQEPRDTLEIFTVRMPLLFDSMLVDPALLVCVRRMLDTKREDANRLPMLLDVSRGFAETLINFLVNEKLDALEVRASGFCTNPELQLLSPFHQWRELETGLRSGAALSA